MNYENILYRDFLNGFHKRRNERKKRAKDEELAAFKEDKRKIKQKKKDDLDARLKRYEILFEKVKSVENRTTFETPDSNITITEITDIDLSGTGTRIGANLENYSDLEAENEEEQPKERKHRKTVFTHKYDRHFKLKEKRKNKKSIRKCSKKK